MKHRIALTVLMLLCALPAAGFGQGAPAAAPTSVLAHVSVDRVVAIVGTTPILWSDVLEVVNQRRAGGMKMPDDSAGQIELAKQVISDLVDEELLVERAAADTGITVSDADLNATVEDELKSLHAQIPNDQQFLSELKASGFGGLEDYRRWLMDEARRRELQQRYVQKLKRDGKMINVAVTEADIKDAYERQKDNLPKRPPSVTFRQIVIATTPSDKARQTARMKADSVLLQIRAGADFSQLAKRVSMDSVSAAQGGDLGWSRREQLVPQFANMLFSLAPGQMGIVETQYGFHIVRVDRVRPGEVRAHQILIKPHYDSSDVVRSHALADSVLKLWKTSAVPYDTLLKRYHDKDEVEGSLDPYPRDSLPASYAQAFTGKTDSSFVEPFAIQDPQRGVPKFVIAQIISTSPAGNYTLAELRERIRSQLEDERSFRRLIDTLKKETYVWVNVEGAAGIKAP